MKKSTVVVIYNQEGQILLLKRGKDHKMFPGEWCFPGGKLDWVSEVVQSYVVNPLNDTAYTQETINNRWEEYAECVVRECFEETGIRLISFFDVGDWLSDSEFLVKVFHSHTIEEPTVVFPNREHYEWGWFHLDELPNGVGRMTMEQIEKEMIRKEHVL